MNGLGLCVYSYTVVVKYGHRMLQLVLVLLFAGSAMCAPSVVITQAPISEFPLAQDSGRLVSSYLTDRSFEIVDGADTNIYILTVQQILNDLANQPDSYSQALSIAQTIAVLGELATGVSGDACAYASVVDAFAQYSATNNAAALRAALPSFIGRLQTNIDLITQLANNPSAQRYAAGVRGNCGGSGRVYQFEAAWEAVLANANPYQITLLNEEYCAAKRLYAAFNSRSNNVGAALTAAAVPSVVEIFEEAIVPTANFLRAVSSGGNPSAAAAAAKSAIAQSFASARV